MTTKTLDTTISRVGDDGQFTSLSTKCTDMNEEMFRNMGVTEPILNYVIFCHQEESNWPLGTSLEVKKIFDQIFSADKYIKALDEIKKVRLEHMSNLKGNLNS